MNCGMNCEIFGWMTREYLITYLIISGIGVYIMAFLHQVPINTSDNDTFAIIGRLASSFIIAVVFLPFGIVIVPAGIITIIKKIIQKKKIIVLRESKFRQAVYKHFGC